jgi:hypothetical protein
MTAPKGYVVRATDIEGLHVYALSDDGDLYVTAVREDATLYTTADAAHEALCYVLVEFDVSGGVILRVTDDGETPLPTYEEALAMLAEIDAAIPSRLIPTHDELGAPMSLLDRVSCLVTEATEENDLARDIVSAIQREKREKDALLTLLDRIDTDGKSLPSDIRAEMAKVLDDAREKGWRRP